MNNQNTVKKPPKKLYDKAVSGDKNAILEIADYYCEHNLPYKALEWYRYGGNKGVTKCMFYAAVKALNIANDLMLTDKRITQKCLDMFVESKYWMNKVFDEYDEYMDNGVTIQSIESLKENFDSKLGEYYFEFAIDEKTLETPVVPKL